MKTSVKSITLTLISLLFLATLFTGCEKDDGNVAVSQSVQEVIATYESDFEAGGIVALVREADGTTDYGKFGESEAGVPLSETMSFGIGSDTKTFTAVLIFKLIDDGELSLSDKLSDLLPGVVNENISGEITIQQLLNHSSGLNDYINSNIELVNSTLTNPSYVYSINEILSYISAPDFEPGAMHGYSNTNYILLGLIVEEKTGKPYHEHLRETLLDPLGLSDTWLNGKETPVNAIAYSWNNDVSLENVDLSGFESLAWAAGSLFSTADDMATWYDALFNGDVLSESSLQQMLTATFGEEQLGYYGSGIFSEVYNGHETYFHGGSRMGYYSTPVFNATTGAIIVIFTNERKFVYAEDGTLAGNDDVTFPMINNIKNDLLDVLAQ